LVRPSHISTIVAAVIIGLGSLFLGIYALVERPDAKPWFYWTAPLLALGFAAIMAQLAVMYYLKVGRLEHKGRPRK
jgi:hypothetical protein